MFDWIIDGLIFSWIVKNYGSLVSIFAFTVLSILAYKRMTAPTGTMQTQNYKDNQKSMTIPKTRKIITMILTGTIWLMGITLFGVGIYKDMS